jgi:hypothetical protein
MRILTSSNLSPREEAFCLAIVEGRSESDAYRKAYRPQRAKAKTIHEMASRLMAKPKVRTRIAELMEPLIERAQLTRKEWLNRLARICLADVRKMFDPCGNSIPVIDLGPKEAAAIAAFEVYEMMAASSDISGVCGRMLRVRMVDQLKALELYGKAMGYFAEQWKVTGSFSASAPSITVEFVDPADWLRHPAKKETLVPEKPRSITACGGPALTN